MNEIAAKALFTAEMPALLSLSDLRGWEVHSAVYPLVDVTFTSTERMPLRVQMHAPDWSDTPPGVTLLLPSGEPCPSEKLPQHNMFNRSQHNITGKPFICSPGTIEYHTHPSHVNDLWDNHRRNSRNSLPGLISQIWDAWLIAPKTP